MFFSFLIVAIVCLSSTQYCFGSRFESQAQRVLDLLHEIEISRRPYMPNVADEEQVAAAFLVQPGFAHEVQQAFAALVAGRSATIFGLKELLRHQSDIRAVLQEPKMKTSMAFVRIAAAQICTSWALYRSSAIIHEIVTKYANTPDIMRYKNHFMQYARILDNQKILNYLIDLSNKIDLDAFEKSDQLQAISIAFENEQSPLFSFNIAPNHFNVVVPQFIASLEPQMQLRSPSSVTISQRNNFITVWSNGEFDQVMK